LVIKNYWTLKLSKLSLLLLLILPISLQAQQYLFPVKPGQRNLLSGNFSEIRPNHFHSGIDVKIGGVDGEPILAIADGYVFRLKVSSMGYGNVLYIKHHDGQTSVYAHLRNFSPRIMDFMRKEMYFAQKNELEVFPDPEFLPVKRGEIIGNGGNTGSSGGPHLHFEIRDSLDRAIDPLKYNFKEVVDNTPPVVHKVAFRPLDPTSRVNGKFQRLEFTPVLEGGRYIVPDMVKISGRVGLEIHAVDKMDLVNNIFGVPIYELMEEGKPLFRINVDHIDFNKGRFLLTHTHQNRFIRLYHFPNNTMEIYEPYGNGAGAITAAKGERKKLQVNLKDYYGNLRPLTFLVEGEEAPVFIGNGTAPSRATQVSYHREVMMVEADKSDWGTLARVYVNSHEMQIPPAYIVDGRRTYLWDMSYGIPDSVDICTEVIIPAVQYKVPFGQELAFSNSKLEIKFAENTLLDDLYLHSEIRYNNGKPIITINSQGEYLQNNMEVKINDLTFQGSKERTHVYVQYSNGGKSFVGGEWIGGDIRFKTRNFGTFVLDEDKTAPTITAVRVTANELRFVIKDDKSGIRDFEAWVDGKWVLMRYEHKQQVIWSEKSDKLPFKGEVILKVRDMAGNEARYTSRLN
jgi:hypothetical protein